MYFNFKNKKQTCQEKPQRTLQKYPHLILQYYQSKF
jgi:hypothetical protein